MGDENNIVTGTVKVAPNEAAIVQKNVSKTQENLLEDTQSRILADKARAAAFEEISPKPTPLARMSGMPADIVTKLNDGTLTMSDLSGRTDVPSYVGAFLLQEKLHKSQMAAAEKHKQEEEKRIRRQKYTEAFTGLAHSIGDIIKAHGGATVTPRDVQSRIDALDKERQIAVQAYMAKMDELNANLLKQREKIYDYEQAINEYNQKVDITNAKNYADWEKQRNIYTNAGTSKVSTENKYDATGLGRQPYYSGYDAKSVTWIGYPAFGDSPLKPFIINKNREDAQLNAAIEFFRGLKDNETLNPSGAPIRMTLNPSIRLDEISAKDKYDALTYILNSSENKAIIENPSVRDAFMKLMESYESMK